MTRARRAALGAIAIGAVTLALAGCEASVSVGGDPSLSAAELEQAIRDQYAEQNPGITLTELTCEDAEGEVGAEITCEGRNSREVELEIGGEVTRVDEGEETADYDWRVTRAFAPGALYERAARQVLLDQTQVPVATVECPVRIEVVVGSRVSCTVRTADGRPLPVVLELTDLDGGFRISEG
ncbi:MAG: DUF4333 domain-containing protein [Thermoleophilia bacterium]